MMMMMMTTAMMLMTTSPMIQWNDLNEEAKTSQKQITCEVDSLSNAIHNQI